MSAMIVWQVIKWSFLLYLAAVILQWIFHAVSGGTPRPGGQTQAKAGGTIPLPGSWEVNTGHESGPPFYVFEEKGIKKVAYRGSNEYAEIAGEISRAKSRRKRIG